MAMNIGGPLLGLLFLGDLVVLGRRKVAIWWIVPLFVVGWIYGSFLLDDRKHPALDPLTDSLLIMAWLLAFLFVGVWLISSCRSSFQFVKARDERGPSLVVLAALWLFSVLILFDVMAVARAWSVWANPGWWRTLAVLAVVGLGAAQAFLIRNSRPNARGALGPLSQIAAAPVGWPTQGRLVWGFLQCILVLLSLATIVVPSSRAPAWDWAAYIATLPSALLGVFWIYSAASNADSQREKQVGYPARVSDLPGASIPEAAQAPPPVVYRNRGP